MTRKIYSTEFVVITKLLKNQLENKYPERTKLRLDSNHTANHLGQSLLTLRTQDVVVGSSSGSFGC